MRQLDYFINSRSSAAIEHHLIPNKDSKIIEKNDELLKKIKSIVNNHKSKTT